MRSALALSSTVKSHFRNLKLNSSSSVLLTKNLFQSQSRTCAGFRLISDRSYSSSRSTIVTDSSSPSVFSESVKLFVTAKYILTPVVTSRFYSSSSKHQKPVEIKRTDKKETQDSKKGHHDSSSSTVSRKQTQPGGGETGSARGDEGSPAPNTSPAGTSSKKETIGVLTAATKKRAKRKAAGSKSTVIDDYGYTYEEGDDSFPITAYALCDEFDLKDLHKGLIAQGLYIPTVLSEDLSNVIHVTAKYPIGNEPREIFFFREGAVVFWNVSYLEQINVLKFLKEFEDDSYDAEEVQDECEIMRYTRVDQGSSRLLGGKVVLGEDSGNSILEKYAFANALASSVKLGIWESTLEKYVEGIEHITEALKRAEDIKLSRAEVLQKTGELFALRHQLNLNSDLLDTPDFYWERERLETLYQKTCDYLSINRRTKVMNEKLEQCCELLELISSHLTDQHHTRLEWMIIVLIMIEVGFEILHLLERYELIHT